MKLHALTRNWNTFVSGIKQSVSLVCLRRTKMESATAPMMSESGKWIDLVSSDDDVSSDDEVLEVGVVEGRVSSSSKVKFRLIGGNENC